MALYEVVIEAPELPAKIATKGDILVPETDDAAAQLAAGGEVLREAITPRATYARRAATQDRAQELVLEERRASLDELFGADNWEVVDVRDLDAE